MRQTISRGVLAGTLLAALVILTTVGSPVIAQEGDTRINSRYPVATGEYDSPFVAVAEKLKPAVVHVKVVREQTIRFRHPFMDNPFFRDFFGPSPDQEEGEPRTREVPASGSGVIIDADGLVVTNNHVVDQATEITVKLADGTEREATIVGTDPETDLALLNIGSVNGDQVAELGNSDDLRIGEWAIAMGNPVGLEWTLTVGVVSAKGRSGLAIAGGGPSFQNFIQTDASINFGNSGGPLVNIHGQVIGINAAINPRAQNIGFAIPANMVRAVVDQLREHGTVERGYLGMVPRELTPLIREALELDEDVDGVFVETVERGTPADKGGLRASDVIVKVDGKDVSEVQDFRFRIADHAPGEEMSLTVLRQGKRKKLEFTLGSRSEYLASMRGDGQREPEEQTEVWMGLQVTGLDDPRVHRLDLEVNEGVIVIGLEDDSPAAGKLRPGDVIFEVNQKPIEDMGDWREVTSELGGVDRAVLVQYHPQGRSATRFVALKQE